MTYASRLPRLSIVTICFNAERFIRRTIESVLVQDYPNLEYSVIDGGSNDATPTIIAEYAPRLAWWVSEPDSGVSEAFNKGIARHTGEFIGFLNAGDYFASPTVLSHLFATADSSADIVYGKARLTFDPPVRGRSEMIVGANYRPVHKLPTAHQAMLYRRTIWERYGVFRLDYRYAMDYEHYLRFRQDEVRGVLRYSFADVVVAERPLTSARNSFGNPSRTYREYLRADSEHGNNIGIVMNSLKFLRDRWKELSMNKPEHQAKSRR
jgi:glycosyltransferase involved in cell wall biosynthesis